MRYLLLSIFVICFFSCTKKNTHPVNAKLNDTSAGFIITGITDTILISKNDSLIIPFSILATDSTPNTVYLYIDGMPLDVYDSLSIITDTASFEDSLLIITNKSIPGIYPITIYGVDSVSDDTVSKAFNLVIETPGDCEDEIIGYYYAYYGGIHFNNCQATQIYMGFNGLMMTLCIPFDSTVTGGIATTLIYGGIDCSTNTINFSQQQNGSNNLSATGHYNKDGMILNFTHNGKKHIAKLVRRTF